MNSILATDGLVLIPPFSGLLMPLESDFRELEINCCVIIACMHFHVSTEPTGFARAEALAHSSPVIFAHIAATICTTAGAWEVLVSKLIGFFSLLLQPHLGQPAVLVTPGLCCDCE